MAKDLTSRQLALQAKIDSQNNTQAVGSLSGLTTTDKTSIVASVNEVNSQLAEIAPLSGTTDPTTSTVGVVKQSYVNTFTGRVFICTAASGGVYTWVAQALKSVVDQINTEKTGYGVVSGLVVTAQGTPNMTVAISDGVAWMASGVRYAPSAVASQSINTADVINPRIDIIYLSSAGIITYLAGAAVASPAAPAVPAGGLLLAEIAVAAGATSIQGANIIANKATVFGGAWIKPTLLNGWTNYGAPFQDVAYYKDSSGIVRFRGVIKSGSVAAMFAIPAGYRPAGRIDCLCACDVAAATRVNIQTGIVPLSASGFTWMSLANISYRAEA